MKLIFLFVFFLFMTNTVTGQENNGEDTTIYKVVKESPAEFPGGFEALYLFINKNLIYPKTTLCVEGKVYVKFIVERDGTLSNIQIQKVLQDLYDAQVIKVFEMIPKWNPAKLMGKTVRQEMVLPVKFTLGGGN